MTERLARMFDAMEGALREHALPKLQDSFARGQVYGVIYMLRHVALHTDWATAPLRLQIGRIQALHAELQALGVLSEAPLYPADVVRESERADSTGTQLAQARDTATAWLDAMICWHAGSGQQLNVEVLRRVGKALHGCAWAVNNDQAKLTTQPMFAQISTGVEPASR